MARTVLAMPTSASATGFTPQDSDWKKLDSETHENILHDGAVFCIYAAKRDDTKDGEGKVLFYEEDTQIAGSEEFLTAMGALDIRPVLRGRSFRSRLIEVPEKKESGAPQVPGVSQMDWKPQNSVLVLFRQEPRCVRNRSRFSWGNRSGLQTGVMKAFVTVRDGLVSRPGNHSENDRGDSQEKWF